MGDSIVSDEAMSCIRRTCYEAGRTGREVYTVRCGRPLVRCADCANLAVAADGSRYCNVWGRKVPLDGYCHLGERKGDS